MGLCNLYCVAFIWYQRHWFIKPQTLHSVRGLCPVATPPWQRGHSSFSNCSRLRCLSSALGSALRAPCSRRRHMPHLVSYYLSAVLPRRPWNDYSRLFCLNYFSLRTWGCLRHHQPFLHRRASCRRASCCGESLLDYRCL